MVEEESLNWEQKRAIELEKINPELANFHLEEGRRKQGERIVQEIIEEERTKEQIEKEFLQKHEEEKFNKEQEHFESQRIKEHSEFNCLADNVLTALACKLRNKATELMVEYIKKTNYIYTTKDDLKSEMWIYEDGIYRPNGKSCITEICRHILGAVFTPQLVNEVIAKIEADTFIDSEQFFKNDYVDEVPVLNGILNLKTKRLYSFEPKKIFFNKIQANYNPEAKCPFITKHFSDVLKNENDVKVMFEIFGFLLYKDYFIEKAVMFLGDGRNGKGKTIDLMKRFLGANNCCSVPLNSLSDGGFRTWDLFGCMANLAGDLSSTALKDTSTLKQTTGRDLIGADRKNRSTVNFINYAKHIFACNDLPKVYDFSRGFWERWVLFEFPYTFVKKEIYDDLEKEEKKKFKIMNPFIIEQITTQGELSGLLNESLDGLHRILKQKDFSYSVGIDEIKKFWVRKSDSFTAFAMDNLEESFDGKISKALLRKSFYKYCKEFKLKGASDKNIKVVLEEMFGVTDSQETGGERVWEGIKLKEKSKYNFIGGKLSQE